MTLIRLKVKRAQEACFNNYIYRHLRFGHRRRRRRRRRGPTYVLVRVRTSTSSSSAAAASSRLERVVLIQLRGPSWPARVRCVAINNNTKQIITISVQERNKSTHTRRLRRRRHSQEAQTHLHIRCCDPRRSFASFARRESLQGIALAVVRRLMDSPPPPSPLQKRGSLIR